MSIKELQLEQQPIEVKQIHARFTQVEQALVTEFPGLPEALADIHKQLQSHEELIHIFSDEDIAVLHQAFEKYKQVSIVTKSIKKSSSKKKLSNDDLATL